VIDRAARNKLAEGMRHLGAGILSNTEFEKRVITKSVDPAIQAVFVGGPWFLYHDLSTYKLRGPYRLRGLARKELARCVMFLKTDLEYEWPVQQRGVLSSLLWSLVNLATFGMFANVQQRRFMRAGDFSVWPFIRRSDYEAALSNPVYLAKRSNYRLLSDVCESALRASFGAPKPER
jgi:hypothetical protein